VDLEPHSVGYVSVSQDLHLDIDKEEPGSAVKFKINDRNMKPEHVHLDTDCDILERSRLSNHAQNEDSTNCEVCECGAKGLFKFILDKMEQEEGSKSKFWLADKQRELLSFTPREIKVMPKENDPESATLSWEVNEANRRLNRFEVTLSWGEAFTKKYLHDEGKEDNVGQKALHLGTQRVTETRGHCLLKAVPGL
jgi:hypothetical protein